MKYRLYFCERCARCRDPKRYCKHRPACVIWFMAKDRKKHAAVGGERVMVGFNAWVRMELVLRRHQGPGCDGRPPGPVMT